jgi:tetratricopeptide (TPR) repeat protein
MTRRSSQDLRRKNTLNGVLTGVRDDRAMSSAAQSYSQGLKHASQGRHVQAIACYEQALAADPSDIKVLFALGNTARALGMGDAAQEFFRQVLAREPDRIEALVNLANLLRTRGQFEAATALLAPALARHPANPELLLTLGSVHREQGDNDAAAAQYRLALAARPNYPAALSNLADLAADDGDFDAARTLYDQAIKADSGNAPAKAQARLNRAILHFLAGDLKSAWRDYAARTEIPGKVPATEQRLAAWTGGPLKKARLLVRAEQGVGDQIMFASCLPELAARAKADGGTLIVECEPRLVALLARSLPGCTVKAADWKTVGGVVTADYAWLKSVGGANLSVLMGSVPRYLRGSLAAFPADNAFLKPEPNEQLRWHGEFAALGPIYSSARSARGPVVGICWRSGKSGGHRSVQYAPLEAWGEFLRDLPGSLVCAQYDAGADEIAELERLSGRKIFVPPGLDQKNELDRACAMLSALDALVSAPTAVSWLGAGAGVPTFKTLYDTSWTAFGQAYEPLAPSCVCVMPKARGDWADVFAQAAAAIKAL